MKSLKCEELAKLNLNPADFDRVYSLNENNSVLCYLRGYLNGFISNGKVITAASFTPDARIIAKNFILAHRYKNIPHYNVSVLLDAHTGEELVENFDAYFIQGHYLAFRVNGADMPSHRWGIYSLTEHKMVHTPTLKYEHIHKYVDSLMGKEE